MSDAKDLTVRRFDVGDASDVRRLAIPEIDRSSYRSGWSAAIDAVVRASDPDVRGLVAIRGGAAAAFAIYGTIAGSEGAGRIQLVVTDARFRRMGIARRLVDAAVEELRSSGARFVSVEIPADRALTPAISLLERCGFHVEARVRDFYRDGVDLAVFRRDVTAP